jgi:hypothetical protein
MFGEHVNMSLNWEEYSIFNVQVNILSHAHMMWIEYSLTCPQDITTLTKYLNIP